MRHQKMCHLLPLAPFKTDRMSLALFSTIDMPRFASLAVGPPLVWPCTQSAGTESKARKANQRAETSELRSSDPCPVNGRSCRRSSCTPAELYPPHERTDFITLLDGRVFDARNLSYQSLVGALSTRDWARFRLTKTIFF